MEHEALAVSFITPARKSLNITNRYIRVHSCLCNHLYQYILKSWCLFDDRPCFRSSRLWIKQPYWLLAPNKKTQNKNKLFIAGQYRLLRDVWECNSLENARLIGARKNAKTKRFTAIFTRLHARLITRTHWSEALGLKVMPFNDFRSIKRTFLRHNNRRMWQTIFHGAKLVCSVFYRAL